MDHNEVLRELRSITQRLIEDSLSLDDKDFIRYATLFQWMDNHLVAGGDLPDDWSDCS